MPARRDDSGRAELLHDGRTAKHGLIGQPLTLPDRTVVRRAVEPDGPALDQCVVDGLDRAAILLPGGLRDEPVGREPYIHELDRGVGARVTVRGEKFPGCRGTSTRGIPISWARASACIGPAPPKAISVKSRGSCPRWIEISRIAEVIRATAIVTMPSASASTVIGPPRRRPRSATAPWARPASSAIAPPRRLAVPMRPSTTLASVTVGSVPPSPYAA